MEHLVKTFHDLKERYSVEENNAHQLVANAALNIENLLANRSKALKILAKKAEDLQMEHEWRDNISELNSSNPDLVKRQIFPEFKEDPVFKRLVSYNSTAVHIPTDIYEGSTIVLNELSWTQALDETFKKNKEEDPSLLWQVFGSATGLARYFPASPWMDTRKTPNKIDLYDVRRRPCVCVCVSGSVSGLTLKLIRTSVSEMLETLSDDDYVNVVSFSAEAQPVACFNNLVQANVRNKKILKKAVQNITANGTTDYKKGFRMAFDQLSLLNVSRANCNKIIMLFTDGGEDRASEIFDEFNRDRKVRIFTFSVGQHNYDKGPIKWMACSNKGYYYEIPSIGAIRINTQEYLDVLGRPMVKADEDAKKVQWTNVYQDALELGLVITGTLPVFNKTGKTSSRDKNKLILGVMAIDVSLDDIKRLTPRFTLGPNGYYFAIDPNGYVLLHPNLLPENTRFEEPVTLDFLDAELENENKVEVKFCLRLCSFSSLLIADWTTDCFIWISLALVLPEYSVHYIQPRIGDTITQAKCKCLLNIKTCFFLLYEKEGILQYNLPEYCKDLKPQSSNNTEFLIEFNEYIDRKTPNHPLSERISARFVATDGGITRVYPKSAGLDWNEEPETYESSFYKRSLDNNIYIFTPPLPDNNSRKSVCVSVCVCVCVCVCSILVHYPLSYLSPQNVDCVLLDNGGFLVMANQDHYIDKIGQFFGVIDPILMINLLNESLFSFNKTYDYQSVCYPVKENRSSAGLRSVYVPTIADILNVGWWASAAPDDDVLEKESCITEQTQYFFANNETSFKGNMECANCSRQFIAEKLWKTNLVLIIADAKESCKTCDVKPLIQAEQPSSGPDPCVIANNPRYRKGPVECFDDNESVSQTPFMKNHLLCVNQPASNQTQKHRMCLMFRLLVFYSL
uniref:VWFA domain-containing protein n=1 Tax=Pygocentrus nattereri TaxID=42514 RepID=A0AAR2IJU1_PYGNA